MLSFNFRWHTLSIEVKNEEFYKNITIRRCRRIRTY